MKHNRSSDDEPKQPQPQPSPQDESPPVGVDPAQAQPAAKPDPDVEMFRKQRISQAVSPMEAGKKLLEFIPVRKPTKEMWVRTHPDKNYWYMAPLIELNDNNEVYFLREDVFEALRNVGEKMVTVKMLALTCNRNQVLTFWPLGLAGEDGRWNPWHESGMRAAKRGRKNWIRITSDRSLGAYEIHERPPDKVEPHWPDLPVEQLLKIAFKGRVITSLDHPVIRELRGLPTDNPCNATDALNRILDGED